MAKQVQFRRGSGLDLDNFTGAEGEITVNTDDYSLRVHDGSTEGGFRVGGNPSSSFSDYTINAFAPGTPTTGEVFYAVRAVRPIYNVNYASIVYDAIELPSALTTFSIKNYDGIVLATISFDSDGPYETNFTDGNFDINQYERITFELTSAANGISGVMITIQEAEEQNI